MFLRHNSLSASGTGVTDNYQRTLQNTIHSTLSNMHITIAILKQVGTTCFLYDDDDENEGAFQT